MPEPSPGHVEPVRVAEPALVTVRGPVNQHHPSAGRNRDAVQVDLAAGRSADKLQGSGEASPATLPEDGGYRATVRLLSGDEPPTAIFAVDDTTCVGAASTSAGSPPARCWPAWPTRPVPPRSTSSPRLPRLLATLPGDTITTVSLFENKT
jgi:hypothetical protein